MPTYNNKRLRGLVISTLCATLIGVGGERAIAQSHGEVEANPFAVHDLEATRNTNAFFDAGRPGVDSDDSLKRLEYAAEEGSEVAMWKLGRIYSSRPGGGANHVRAFEMYSRVVRSQADFTPYSNKAPFTASALVSLGWYYRNGIPNSPIQKNTEKAWSMFLTAATYYGDANAQFALFEMCDAQAVEDCSNVQAGRWLKKSAVNGDVKGQAQFGYRQFEGEKGVQRNKIEGLKWLTIARKRAHPVNHEWIQDLHERAFSVANVEERAAAISRAEIWLHEHCNDQGTCR